MSHPSPLRSAAVLALALAAAACSDKAKEAPPTAPPEPGDAVVALIGLEFAPRTVEVPVGRRVLWQWTDSVVHNVVSDDFASSEALNGGIYAVRFDRAGTFEYRCTLHTGMEGTVVATA